jgi:hypothetical protein
MGRARQTKEECHDKYDQIDLNYEQKHAHAQEMISLWQAAEGDPERTSAIWHWNGVLARYEKAILKLPARRAKSCDWRE